MNEPSTFLFSLVHDSAQALAETLWPLRCAVCDEPGEVLCGHCARQLLYLDWWRACPHCGAPFGRVQCSECNAVSLARSNRDQLPFDGCASAVVFDEAAARVVRTYKDQGERGLADTLATLMAHVCVPTWDIQALTFVPASAAAQRRRGFDHVELLATKLGQHLNFPVIPTLLRPRARDQRALSRSDRWNNMTGRFEVDSRRDVLPNMLLIDDVYTTGATLFGATEALRNAGAQRVFCLTFARVW